MEQKKEKPMIGTHARVVISNWPVISELIIKHGQLIKEQTQEPIDPENSQPMHVINRREIEDALEGPIQGFFKEKITAYSKISRIRLHLTLMEDETFKDRRAQLSDEDKVPENILSNTSASDLSKIQKALDQLSIDHEEAWQKLREAASHTILENLNQLGLALSELEIKEFLDPEPISELLERYVTLNIEFPKARKSEMNISKYLTLKANVTIQSALSRQHKPNTPADIQKVLKQLKSDFNAIAKEESELLASQKTATNETVANISW